MALSDEIREQHKLVAEKGFKYKLDYFLEYYKWATLAVIIGLIVVISFIHTIVTNKDSAFTAVFINAACAPNNEVFAEYADIDTEKYSVVFDTSYIINLESNDQTTYYSLQKMMAQVAAKSIDVVLGDPDTLIYYAANECYADLRDYFSDEYLASLKDKVIYTTYSNEDTQEKSDPIPVIIDVSDSKLLLEAPCYGEKAYFAIVVNTQHSDKVLKFYDFLYDEAIKDRALEGVEISLY